jgi:hypothetical protein
MITRVKYVFIRQPRHNLSNLSEIPFPMNVCFGSPIANQSLAYHTLLG